MKIYNYLLNIIAQKGAAFFILIDPDKMNEKKIPEFTQHCYAIGVDGFLIGGSLLMNGDFQSFLKTFKSHSKLPVIIFPGGVEQVSSYADAILYLSVISGRNPEHLIGKHVLSAPMIKKVGIEPISTGYMLIESGRRTTVEYFTGSNSIPRNKTDIAVATALAGEYLGMKLIYLEAGSGADETVPFEMIKKVSENCSVPIVVGGGIRNPSTALRMVQNGAKIVVTGNHFEDENNWSLLKEFADSIHKQVTI